MSLQPSDTRPADTPRRRPRPPRLTVDRVACTGHGMCADVLPGRVYLDEWGYPILTDGLVDAEEGEVAVRMCPARALYWTRGR